MNRSTDISRLKEIAGLIEETYADGVGINPVEGDNLPRRAEVIDVTEKLFELIFYKMGLCHRPLNFDKLHLQRTQ